MPVKKYKLLAPSDDTKVRPCAFFLLGNGCRNGENCKFSHVNPTSADNGLDVVSPEEKSEMSSESGEVFEQRNPFDEGPYEESPFDTSCPAPESQEKGKKRKNRRSANNSNPFPVKKEAKTEPPTKTLQISPAAPKQENPKAGLLAETAESKMPAQDTRKIGVVKTVPTDFRSLNLPIANFELKSATNNAKPEESNVKINRKEPEEQEKPKGQLWLAVPKSTEVGRKWLPIVKKCQEDSRFQRFFDFKDSIKADEPVGGLTAWVKAKPFGDWCRQNPQIISIDCEMCETEDPVSKQRNSNALCRVSIIDALTDEVLLNTLVKPEWPVVDYRTFINGITESDLANVQFTVRHCQAFLMALCSEETVIAGHAVHHDLKAMRLEHYCVADTSLLFRLADSESGLVSLKDLSVAILGKEMPKTHDSVNDARTALRCLEYYFEKNGNVEAVSRRPKENRSTVSTQLFIHRIPKHVNIKHLEEMFLANTKVAVDSVDTIDFSSGFGKTLVTFRTPAHANLAFETLVGKADEDATGKLQKKVFLRDGKYIRIRKMVHAKTKEGTKFPSPHKTAAPIEKQTPLTT